MDISIIIPVYNAADTIRQCVESVLSQSYKNFELILVDDGSSDKSLDICKEYALRDNRVKVIHKANGGVSSARNKGLDVAVGEWITFIDADDYIGEKYFEGVMGAQEELLIRGYLVTRNNKEISRLLLDDLDPQPCLPDFITRFIGTPLLRGPVLKFYRRNILGDLRFLEDMKVGEDTHFVWSYLAKISTYKILYFSYYYITSALPSEIKYASSTDYAVKSLVHLRDAFELLSKKHGILKSEFLQFIGYFKCISMNDWKKDPSLWYDNQAVSALYAYVWPALSWPQKLRLQMARILKK